MRIIDSHVHIYPKKIALRAASNIGEFYNISIKFDGTVDTVLAVSERAGVDRCLVHSVATSPRQINSINTFISEECHLHPDRFFGFGSLHPDSTRIAEEVDEAISLGLNGIKLHPDFQKFYIDSDEAMKIYECIEGRLPVLFHAGDYRTEYSKAQRIVNVVKTFPKLDVIAAHFGGWSEWGIGARELAACGVYVDTSSSQFMLNGSQVRELINIFGSDKVIFGSDYPMWDAADEIEMLKKVVTDNEEREMIFHGNLERLMRKYGKEI